MRKEIDEFKKRFLEEERTSEEYKRYGEVFNDEEQKWINISLKNLINKKVLLAQHGTAGRIKQFRNKVIRFIKRDAKAQKELTGHTPW